MKKSTKNLLSIFALCNLISSLFYKSRREEKSNPTLKVNISDFSDSWNRIALKYARDRRTLSGLLPELRFHATDEKDADKMRLLHKITITESTNEWNRLALEYVKRKRTDNRGR